MGVQNSPSALFGNIECVRHSRAKSLVDLGVSVDHHRFAIDDGSALSRDGDGQSLVVHGAVLRPGRTGSPFAPTGRTIWRSPEPLGAPSRHPAGSRCSRAPGFATVASNVINGEAENSWRRYFCLANTALRETFFEYSIDPY